MFNVQISRIMTYVILTLASSARGFFDDEPTMESTSTKALSCSTFVIMEEFSLVLLDVLMIFFQDDHQWKPL